MPNIKRVPWSFFACRSRTTRDVAKMSGEGLKYTLWRCDKPFTEEDHPVTVKWCNWLSPASHFSVGEGVKAHSVPLGWLTATGTLKQFQTLDSVSPSQLWVNWSCKTCFDQYHRCPHSFRCSLSFPSVYVHGSDHNVGAISQCCNHHLFACSLRLPKVIHLEAFTVISNVLFQTWWAMLSAEEWVKRTKVKLRFSCHFNWSGNVCLSCNKAHHGNISFPENGLTYSLQ